MFLENMTLQVVQIPEWKILGKKSLHSDFFFWKSKKEKNKVRKVF